MIPIEEGYILNDCVNTMNIGGDDITNYMIRMMNNTGFTFNSKKDAEIVENIKESLGYVSIDFEQECNLTEFQKIKDEFLSTSDHPSSPYKSENMAACFLNEDIEQEYKLPDGQVISIGDIRFKGTEIMFNPEYFNGEIHGLSELLYESIMKIQDKQLIKIMYSTIVLSGGNTMFDGFEDRLKADLKKWNEIDIKVIAPKERVYSVWIGGSILASLDSFQDQWMTRQKYEEEGALMCLMNLPQV